MTTHRLHFNNRAFVDARQRAGISVAELSAATGIHQATIYRIEDGTSVPRADTAKKLARGLGALIADFLVTKDAA